MKTNLFSRAHCIAALLALLGVSSARAGLLFYEPFNYANGMQFGGNVISNGWRVGNPAGPDGDIVSTAAALSYTGLDTQAGSAGLSVSGTPAVDRNAGSTNFPPQTLGTANPKIYCSFLLNVQSPTTVSSNRMLVYLFAQDSDVGAIPGVGVCIDSANRLYVTKKSFAPDTAATAPLGAGTHLIVMRYYSNGGDHPADLWVDPGSLGAAEGAVPSPAADSFGHDNITGQFKAVYISQPANSSGSYFIDEMRVGTTWASVTPVAVLQTVSAGSSALTANAAVTNASQSVLITVTESDTSNQPLTNAAAAVAPVLSVSSGGTLGALTLVGKNAYTATLTAAAPGNVSVTGTIGGAPIGNGSGANIYFAGIVGTNGNFYVGPGFYPGTYNINFQSALGQVFTVWSSTNAALPMAQWTLETDVATLNQTMSEVNYGGVTSDYSFTVWPPTTGQIFYRVRSP